MDRPRETIEIGVSVLFSPTHDDNLYNHDRKGPLAAIVVDVIDRTNGIVNLTVFDHVGRTHARTEVAPPMWAFRE